ncbi:disulfide bond formation protein B [Rudaea sp.]|uniref:disulfide bond formation protein B n=1 Tax=Rudaea sp. TaxID=2136325 RepID=UPI002ED66C08
MTFNPFRWSFRAQFFTGFLACTALLAYAFFVQFQLGIEPCPLCGAQRVVFVTLGIVFLAGSLVNPGSLGRKIFTLLLLLVACIGIGVAGFHLWVQHQPPDPLAGCTPGWNYMIENFPISKTLKMIFRGDADCSVVNWTFLSLSMPFWTLVSFAALGAGAVWAGFHKR